MSHFACVFVCQEGDLEIQAMLLAASLRRFAPAGTEVIAAVPTPTSQWGSLHEGTVRVLDALSVRRVSITNQISPEYPIGNKLSCLSIPTSADRLIFLDSDILATNPFEPRDHFRVPFSALPAAFSIFGTSGWETIYASVGLKPPTTTIKAARTKKDMLPYYNAGFIAVDPTIGFGETWLACCQAIEANPACTKKRPWLDQLGLPVAVHKLGLDTEILPQEYNFAVKRDNIEEHTPYFVHYHDQEGVQQTPQLRFLVQELLAEYPFIGEHMTAMPEWSEIGREMIGA